MYGYGGATPLWSLGATTGHLLLVSRGSNVAGPLTNRSVATRFPRTDGWAPTQTARQLRMRGGLWRQSDCAGTPLWRGPTLARHAEPVFATVVIAVRRSVEVRAAWRPTVVLFTLPGISPRPRASVPARNGCTLAVESGASLLTQGLSTLDQAMGRGEAVPAARCRAAVVAVGLRLPLLLRSLYGPPRPPGGGGWCSPTRSLSVAALGPLAPSGMPGTVAETGMVVLCVRWRRTPLPGRCAPSTPLVATATPRDPVDGTEEREPPSTRRLPRVSATRLRPAACAAGGWLVAIAVNPFFALLIIVDADATVPTCGSSAARRATRRTSLMATDRDPAVEAEALAEVSTDVLTTTIPAHPGTPPRPRASVLARSEWTLAVESWVSLLAQGLPTLDQACGRGGAAPAARCRAPVVVASRCLSLLLRSYHGPPRPPGGGGWCSPTRVLSGTVLGLHDRSGVPGVAGMESRAGRCA